MLKFLVDSVVYDVNISSPYDISLPVKEEPNVEAFGLRKAEFRPVQVGSFIGDTRKGGSVNCSYVDFCPHGHGTHTEAVGHVTKDRISVHEILKRQKTLFPCVLLTVCPVLISQAVDTYPAKHEQFDMVISEELIADKIKQMSVSSSFTEAVIIRTLPNAADKTIRTYTQTNPPYLTPQAMKFLREELKTQHILVDLPSVDREDDGGVPSHCAFWGINKLVSLNLPQIPYSTITELCYVPDNIVDGIYLLNLQVASFDLDAAPARPVIYPLCVSNA